MELLERTLAGIEGQSAEHRELARNRILNFAMPAWSLGRLFDLAVDLAGMTRNVQPRLPQKHIVMMAGDHGIHAEGVSDQPMEVTRQVVENTAGGRGCVRVLAAVSGANLTVVDMGVKADLSALVRRGRIIDRKIGMGTRNFARGSAMERGEAVAAIEAGIEIAFELGVCTDIFATGEMGICNTSPSSAITALLCGVEDLSLVVDRGAGLPPSRLSEKAESIRRGIELNCPDPGDPLDVLSKVGGFEIGGMTGLILGAALLRKPVMLDGFISGAAALIAQALKPEAADYMICSHGSMERGHRYALGRLGKKPLLDLDLRLGEGSGAALAFSLVTPPAR